MQNMRENNPFTLDFGREPNEIIPRVTAMEDLLSAFTAEKPSQHISMITGVRGSGKTVFMTSFCKQIAQEPDWIVVEVSPEQDILQGLVTKLGNEKRLSKLLQRMQLNLSYFGLGLKVEGAGQQVKDPQIALERILAGMKKHGQRLLIAIDEAVNNAQMRLLASTYQILLRQDYPAFLLMTGLYENIRALQDQKTLTFLYRAPRIALQPLNIGNMADKYQSIFNLEREEAIKMARKTRGYSFAFQVLGYFSWLHRSDPEAVESLFRQYLEEYVYEKIWAEMSPTDRKVAKAIAQVPDGRIHDIRQLLGMETNQFNPYRMRLIRKGIVNGDQYGELKFALPLFEQFILEYEG